jgi:hypothetical protein
MSLQTAAQHIASQGRGQDKILVHMTPGEVKGLQAIAMAHGGSLTINPKTGLPEAGFLSNLLPMIAGVALTAVTGGAAAPWMIGLGVGGATALATGSLKKGLMAGLGAFGGAGIGSALSAAGAATTAPGVTGTVGGLAETGAAGAKALTQQTAVNSATAANTAAQAAQQNILASGGSQLAADNAFRQVYLNQVANYSPVTAAGTLSNVGQMGTGAANLVSNAPGARDAFMGNIGGIKGLAGSASSALSPVVGAEPEPLKYKKDTTYIRPYEFTMGQQDVPYRTGKAGESTSEMRYFVPEFTALQPYDAAKGPNSGDSKSGLFSKLFNYSGGGLTALSKGGVPQLEDGGFVFPADVVSHVGNGSTDAGLRILNQKYGAQPIKGPGDGMSDSIPTTIDGRQKALVTDGEAYLDAQTAQKIGPQRLRAVMDKVREARTGKTSQAKEINPNKYLPA